MVVRVPVRDACNLFGVPIALAVMFVADLRRMTTTHRLSPIVGYRLGSMMVIVTSVLMAVLGVMPMTRMMVMA